MNNLIAIKGAGDIASGIAMRLYHAHFNIVMTDIAAPTTVRRSVAFSRAVSENQAQVEDVKAFLAKDAEQAQKIINDGFIAVIVDESAQSALSLKPDVLVDAVIAKKNLGTTLGDAPLVIGVGPGFTAGLDCHAVVETQRGHSLGRVFYPFSKERAALPNTGIPGNIGGYTVERIIRAPADGVFTARAGIGETVEKGALVAEIAPRDGHSETAFPVYAQINGIVRGMLPTGIPVHQGMKCGDIDPRCKKDACFTVSDKALAIAGGVLEAILAHRPPESSLKV
jgi:xanthine dehydrogenase accessory factor